MTQNGERLDIMDTITKLSKRKPILISRPLVALLVLLFIVALIATGLLVYHFTPSTVVNHVNISCRHVTDVHDLERSDTNFSKIISEEYVSTDDTGISQADITTEESDRAERSEVGNLRLPASVSPISYEIYLLPFLQEGNFTFKGNVSIEVVIKEATSNITLNVDQLDIDAESVQLLRSGDNETVEVALREIKNDTKRHFLILQLDSILNRGETYRIQISFVGILTDLMEGFYRSSYVVNHQRRWIAATQFQPTDARKAFPCFDEPAFKATFQINIGRMRNMSSISNMPLLRSSPIEDLPGYVWDHYQESVPMSTYLVAFVVSDLVKVTNGTFSVWTRERATKQAEFSLQIGPSVLKYYEDFFQIKFPLPKMDMVALPDFSSGAMENWGLITYRESLLLYEQGVSTTNNLESIAIVIAHELAHQWFGNLVTPVWWSDLWLNEGFASYMEYLATDAVCPELKTLDQFVVQELQGAFHLDSLKSSHQISVEVNNPDEINNIFDRISYAKGATIIRMMEHFLTTPVFKRGLTKYLREREYSNAEQDDLWSALTEQAHLDGIFDGNLTVKEIMDTWTLQTGYPVVTAIRNETTLILNQERFLISGRAADGDASLWWIPITYKSEKDETMRKFFMTPQSESFFEIGSAKDSWFLLNLNQTGYYRVNYDTGNWQMLVTELNGNDGFKKFDPKNRAQLIDDAMHLANAGLLDFDIALNVTRYLVREREYVPWKAAFNAFDFLYNIFSHSNQYVKFKTYMLHLLDGLYKEVTFHEKSTDPSLKIYIRMALLWRACQLGHEHCRQESMKIFNKWCNEVNPDRSNPISPNLRSAVYCTAIRFATEQQWNFAWERYLNSDVSSEKELLLSALGCSRETWILLRYLEWAITEDSQIRKQDSVRVFSAVSSSVYGRHVAWSFLKENWDKIKKYSGSSLLIFGGIVRETISTFPTAEELDDIKAFVKEKSEDLRGIPRVIEQLVEQAEANLDWKNKYFDKIVRWLSSFNYKS